MRDVGRLRQPVRSEPVLDRGDVQIEVVQFGQDGDRFDVFGRARRAGPGPGARQRQDGADEQVLLDENLLAGEGSELKKTDGIDVLDAVDENIDDNPITPEKVWRALKKRI